MDSSKNISERMRRFGLRVASAAAALLLAASCSDDNMADPALVGDSGNITLKLTSMPTGTRATEADDTGNENLISDAIVCIFRAGASADTDRPLVRQTVNISERTQAQVTMQVNKDKIDEIFPEGVDKAVIHVFANIPAASKAALSDDATLGELKALAVTSNFASQQQPSSFVMFGDSEIEIQRNVNNTSKDQVTGTVRLKRAASKIALNVRVADSVTDLADRVWTPVLNGMAVFINNGVGTSSVIPSNHTLNGTDYYYTSANASDDTHRGRSFAKNEAVDPETGYPYYLTSAFYTYPNQWTDNSETMTYMTLLVPWQSEGSYKSCYYTVPVVRDESQLVNNMSYRVNINVNILGNTAPDEPLELEDVSYRAVPWGQESFDVNISDYRYLVIDNNTYTMNNEGLINIPFYSSHETVIKYDVDTLNYFLFNTTAAGIEKEMAITNTQRRNSATTNADIPNYSGIPGYSEEFGTNKNIYNDWIDNNVDPSTNTRSLYFQHELYQWSAYSGNTSISYGPYTAQGNQTAEARANANLNSITRYTLANTNTEAYSRYRMTITIVHRDKLGQPDEDQFSEKIVIWQYPPMYIEADPNVYILSNNQPFGTAAYGNVYINGTTRTQTSSSNNSMTPSGLTGGNRNPNMYVVSITQLSDDRYQVGDPRSTSVNNLGYDWISAPALGETGNRTLQYYYPADGSNATKFIIAPKLRIASSYGVSGVMNQQTAQQRCAGYQELNCPAGRWRLPTFGELEYIINLSNNGRIPVLFSSDSRYWTAQGSVSGQVNGSGQLTDPTTSTDTHVRCVYDEWYWGDSKVQTNGTVSWTYNWTNYTTPRYPFTWGDRQR